jgi:hypothetical protein
MDNPSFVVNLPAVSVTAGTPVTVFTPSGGTSFTVWALSVSLSVAGSVILKSGNTELLRTPAMPAGSGLYINLGHGTGLTPVRGGVQAKNPGDPLKIDVTATGSVSGFLLVSAS